jgi:hypothetical protein
MAPKNSDQRCKARAKSGKPCRAAATAGGLCFFHANPSKASELGRIGGRRKHHAGAETGDPLPRADTAIAVRETLARLITDVSAGNVNPRVATSLATLINLQLRAIETADLEQRVAKLETLLAETPDPEKQQADDKVKTGLAARIAAGRARVAEYEQSLDQPSPNPAIQESAKASGLQDS